MVRNHQKPNETHHSFRGIDVVVVSGLPAARAVLFVFFAVLFLFVFLYRCGSTIRAFCDG